VWQVLAPTQVGQLTGLPALLDAQADRLVSGLLHATPQSSQRGVFRGPGPQKTALAYALGSGVVSIGAETACPTVRPGISGFSGSVGTLDMPQLGQTSWATRGCAAGWHLEHLNALVGRQVLQRLLDHPTHLGANPNATALVQVARFQVVEVFDNDERNFSRLGLLDRPTRRQPGHVARQPAHMAGEPLRFHSQRGHGCLPLPVWGAATLDLAVFQTLQVDQLGPHLFVIPSDQVGVLLQATHIGLQKASVGGNDQLSSVHLEAQQSAGEQAALAPIQAEREAML